MKITISLVLLVCASLSAAPLREFATVEKSPAPSAVSRSHECTDLPSLLAEWKRDFATYHSDVNYLLNDVADVVASWYYQLRRYEGQNVYLPYGAFDNLYTSSVNTKNNAYNMESHAYALDARLRELNALTAQCIIP